MKSFDKAEVLFQLFLVIFEAMSNDFLVFNILIFNNINNNSNNK